MYYKYNFLIKKYSIFCITRRRFDYISDFAATTEGAFIAAIIVCLNFEPTRILESINQIVIKAYVFFSVNDLFYKI